MNLVEYEVPYTLETKDQLTRGNYIALRCGGSKVTWHVLRVMWIVGIFNQADNEECDIGAAAAELLNFDVPPTITCGGIIGLNYCYIVENDYGHLSKRMAREVLDLGCVAHYQKIYSFAQAFNGFDIGLKQITEFYK